MRRRWASPVLLLALAAAGCGSSHRVTVTATPSSSLADEPVDVVVRGLASHASATIRLTSVDATRTPWSASARFRADGRGSIDLVRSPAVSGYPATWEMGLTAMLQPGKALVDPFYRWWSTRAQTFDVTVRSGSRVVARTSYRRRASATKLLRRTTTVASAGFVGAYVAPTSDVRSALLLFGGSEGGLSPYLTTTAVFLATHGIASLAVGYFALPGTPPTLKRIPLEYFVRAIHWLQRQSHVTGRVAVMGTSRGSEAAQLLGAHFPALVDRVVAVVPSAVVNASYPNGTTAAWTLRGHPFPSIPFSPASDIPVERIRGPLMTICAGADEIWPSCTYASEIAQRRRAHGDAAHDVYLTAPEATHEQTAFLVPDLPGLVAGNLNVPGVVAAERDRERIWPQLLRFLGATP